MDPSPTSPVWCAYYNGFGELLGAAPQISTTAVLGDGEWQLGPSETVQYAVPVADGTTQDLVVTQEVHQSAPVQPYPDFHHDQDLLSRKHEPNLTHESLLLEHNTNFVQESLPNFDAETLHSYKVYPKQDSNYEQESSPTLESYQKIESSYDHLSYQKVESTHTHESSSNHQRPGKSDKKECLECRATFACPANLRNHMRIHTGERPYRCEECDASFTQRSNLRSHKRVHTGERPYMCGICGQTFARSSHLSGHMRTHTGEKPFVCPYCARSFATNQIMKNHLRTHTGERPFVCNVCQATFAQSSCLATHKKIHTGVRDFKCEQCHKAFISRSGLQTHKRVHTGEKPYKCENCTKSFKTSSYLSKHKQKYCCNKSFVNKGTNLKKPVPKPAASRKMSKSRKTVKTSGKHPKRNKSRKSQHPRRHHKSSLEQLLSTPDETHVKQEGGEIEGSQTIHIQGNTGVLIRLPPMQDFTMPTREEGNSLVISKTDSRMYLKDEHLLGVTEYLADEQGVQETQDEYHNIEMGPSLNMNQFSSQSYSETAVFSNEVNSSADISFNPQEVDITPQEIDMSNRDGSVSSREVYMATQDVHIVPHKVDMKCKEVIMSPQESAISPREVLEGVQEMQALPSVSSIAMVTGVKQEQSSGNTSAIWYSRNDM